MSSITTIDEQNDDAHSITLNLNHIIENDEDTSILTSFKSQLHQDGYVAFHSILNPTTIQTLNKHLHSVLFQKEYNRGLAPDKVPKISSMQMEQVQHKVYQIINIHKCDSAFRSLVTDVELGKLVCQLAGWDRYGGVRLAQDQVWAKPPGAPPLAFHRDSPYFMFDPPNVMTVWIALDDMDGQIGPIQYVKSSHTWGDDVNGTNSQFFETGWNHLHSAARHNDIDPDTLDIVPMNVKAGSLVLHNGRTWHGSGPNRSSCRPRRGVGLHFVPANVKFTHEALKSSLWRKYVDRDDVENTVLKECDFPVTYRAS